MMIFVKEIMTENVVTLTLDNNLKEARLLMSENHIRHLPVVDGQSKVIGVVSQRDILAVQESDIFNASSGQKKETQVKVSEFFKEQVVTISPDASALKAAKYIQKHKLGCLPVTVEEKIVGIITDSDFVNVAINLMELSEQTEEVDF
jgi:CBS domain-containing protein